MSEYLPIDGEAIGSDYILLGTDRNHIYARGGLSTESIFEFLLSSGKRNRYVGYVIHFDVIHWLKDAYPYQFGQWQRYKHYHWRYYPRKIFLLRDQARMCVVYDISGYCQSSFVHALAKWGIDVPLMVIEGKAKRGEFSHDDIQFIIEYNRAECQSLKQLFQKIRDAAKIFRVRSWHGAGSIASALIRQYQFHTHSDGNVDVRIAADSSYYGGRIELLKVGTIRRTYTYDIVSAYPHALSQLPTLKRWRHTTRYESGTVGWYYVKYCAPVHAYVGALPVRTRCGIVYPLIAEGWYTSFEVANILNDCEIVEGYVTDDCDRPFSAILELFQLRQTMKREGNEGGSMLLKLGLNSIYGKFAQRIDGRFTDMLIASLITGYVRARLYATCHDSRVIAYATDSITTTEPLDLPIGGLGNWESEHHNVSVFLQPGIYQHDECPPKLRGMPHMNVKEAAAAISLGETYYTSLRLFVTPQLASLRKTLRPYQIVEIQKSISLASNKRVWLIPARPKLLTRYYDSLPLIEAKPIVELRDRKVVLDILE